MAKEMEVESGIESKSAEPSSAASTAPAATGFRKKNFMGKKIIIYLILIFLKGLVSCFLKMLLYFVA